MSNERSYPGSAPVVTDEMVERAMSRFQDAVNSMVMCKRCNGVGYHHGFGEDGHDPDWCEVCGGCQSVPEFEDKEAMREALKVALSITDPVQQAVGCDDILSVLYTYRDHQPEEDESWESWYYAAFDLACIKIRELFGKPGIEYPKPGAHSVHPHGNTGD